MTRGFSNQVRVWVFFAILVLTVNAIVSAQQAPIELSGNVVWYENPK